MVAAVPGEPVFSTAPVVVKVDCPSSKPSALTLPDSVATASPEGV
jgi:hypothetical protein